VGGSTFIELLIVLVVLGVLSAYAVTKSVTSGELTLPSQAQQMASDIRHMQLLASSWGQSLRLTVGPDSYTVSCTSAVAAPCPVSTNLAITDPATGRSFVVTLQKGVVFGSPTTAVLNINSMGQPLLGASYTLDAGKLSTVNVASLTGFVTVTP